MGLLSKIVPESAGEIFLFDISEPESHFFQRLQPGQYEDIQDIKSPVRRLQVLQTRLFLSEKNLQDEFYYLESGKPQLRNGGISISHSGTKLVIYIHPDPSPGIDIEVFHPKILKIAPRFMNEAEKKQFGINNIDLLTIIWSAKETVFKKFGGNTTHFARYQQVVKIDFGSGIIEVVINPEESPQLIRLRFQKNEEYVFTYST